MRFLSRLIILTDAEAFVNSFYYFSQFLSARCMRFPWLPLPTTRGTVSTSMEDVSSHTTCSCPPPSGGYGTLRSAAAGPARTCQSVRRPAYGSSQT